jgi:hypothetical protein
LADFCAFREIPFLSYKKGAARSAPIPQGAVASDAPPRRACEGLIDPSALPDTTLAERKWAWREGAKPGICLQRAPLPSSKVVSLSARAAAFKASKRPTLPSLSVSRSTDRPSHPPTDAGPDYPCLRLGEERAARSVMQTSLRVFMSICRTADWKAWRHSIVSSFQTLYSETIRHSSLPAFRNEDMHCELHACGSAC